MPKKIVKKNKTIKRKNRKTNRRKTNRRKTGGNISNYPLNSFEIDPNYIQVSARNVVQQGAGKKRRVKGGDLLSFAALQFTNPITNFASFYTGSNGSPAYDQPIGHSNYNGQNINYYGNNMK
jgi:hypothetical protein